MKRITRLIFFVILGLLAFGQLQRFQITPDITLFGHDFAIGFWLILVWLTDKEVIKKLSKLVKNKHLRLILAWTGLVFLFNLSILNWQYVAYISRLAFYITFGLTLWQTSILETRDKWLGLGLYSLVFLLWGWWQYLFLPDTRFLAVLGFDDHYYRLIGTTFDPNFSGVILGMMFLIWQFISNSLKKRLDWLKWLGSILLLVSISLTFSRASYISLFIAFIATKLNIKAGLGTVAKAGLVIVLLAGVLLFTSRHQTGEGVNLFRTASINARISYDVDIVSSWSTLDWLIGSGWQFSTSIPSSDRTFIPPNMANLPNNLLVTIIGGWGLVGLLLLSRTLLQTKPWQKLTSLQLGLIILVLVHSQFNNTLLHPLVLPILLILLVQSKKLKV